MGGGGGNEEESTNQLMEIDNRRVVNSADDHPPHDDVCPICLEDFYVPCKGNCGHWFCSNCILQYWTYKGIISPAKCPICKQEVMKFTLHEPSLQRTSGEEVFPLINRIEYYNVLHNGGINGFYLKMKLGFPFFTRTLFTMLTEPDTRIRAIAVAHRVVLLVGCICNMYRVGTALMLDSYEIPGHSNTYYWVELFSAITFCAALLIGLCRILWLRFNVWLVERRLRQLQDENARLRARLRHLLIANGAQTVD